MEAVKQMLNYLYKGDYNDDNPSNGIRIKSQLLNVAVYALADKYDIVTLKYLATSKFRVAWKRHEFAVVLREVITYLQAEELSYC